MELLISSAQSGRRRFWKRPQRKCVGGGRRGEARGSVVEKGILLPGGGLEVLNAAVDESRKSAGRLLDSISLLRDGELLHQLIENLGARGVLGHDCGGYRNDRVGE